MGLIGGILGGVTSAIGGIAAGNKIGQNMRDYQAQLQEVQDEKALEQAVRDNGMYKRAEQDSGYNAYKTATIEALRQANQENAQNVTGGQSRAQQIANTANAAKTIGDMGAKVAMTNEDRQMQAYQQGTANVQAMQQQAMGARNAIASVRTAQANAITGAAKGAAEAFEGISDKTFGLKV